jgi:hypothetical protein
MTVQFLDAASYPTITVEIGFSTVSSGSSTWGTGLWNTADWSGRDVVWTDVSAYVRTISSSRDKNRDVDQFQSGTAQVTFSNIDARFTPANTTGPYASGGVTKIVPRVPIRIRATWASTTYGVFYGRVNSWADSYPGQGKDCVTTINCSDVLADLATVNLAELLVAVGTGEAAGQRISRILNASGWLWGTDLNAGALTTMQGTVYADSALSLVQTTAESDGGAVFADQDGQLVYHDPYWEAGARSTRATTAQIVFGSGVGEVKFTDPQLTYDDTMIFNSSTVTREGGVEQASLDADSVSLYGTRSISHSGLFCETDEQAAVLADFDVFRFADPEYRVASLIVYPASSAAAYWPLILGARVGDLCTVDVPTPAALTITRSVFITGISHTLTSSGGWVVQFGFASAATWTPVQGGWDTGLWDTVAFFV